MKKLLALAFVLAAPVFGMAVPAAYAETPPGAAFPTRTVRLMVPAAAGSAPDFLARVLGQKLSETWGQPVIVDNVVGAGGTLPPNVSPNLRPMVTRCCSTRSVRSQSTSACTTSCRSIQSRILCRSRWSAKVPNILCVHPERAREERRGANCVCEAESGKLRYGSPGSGHVEYLSAELLNTMAGIKLFHVPYKSKCADDNRYHRRAGRADLPQRTGRAAAREVRGAARVRHHERES